MADNSAPTDRTRVVREPQRAVYDRKTIYQILDEGFLCHVGFSIDRQTYVLPTLYARLGDALYIHGSASSRMLGTLDKGIEACVTVTLLDGIVLARSVFNHSMNYRSVVALGRAYAVDTLAEKTEALRAFSEKILPGRWNVARQPNRQELEATRILRLPLTEVSAKARTGSVEDNPADYGLPVWAGIIPLRLAASPPIRDNRSDASLPPPVNLPPGVHWDIS